MESLALCLRALLTSQQEAVPFQPPSSACTWLCDSHLLNTLRGRLATQDLFDDFLYLVTTYIIPKLFSSLSASQFPIVD